MKYSDIEYLKKYIKEKNLDKDYYDKCLKELEKGKPIQYIIGEVNFYGYSFKVNESVLIPRYETELLTDLTIKRINKLFMNKPVDILDLGTGSGCIAITLKKETNSSVTAIDISKEALQVAKNNAKLNNAIINFINKDMTKYNEGKYDVIISNPPYIAYDEDIEEIVKNNEPHLALYAKNNGLYFYEKIMNNIHDLIKEKYLICFEIGANQGIDISNIIISNLPDAEISIVKDYSNLDRFIFATNIKKPTEN